MPLDGPPDTPKSKYDGQPKTQYRKIFMMAKASSPNEPSNPFHVGEPLSDRAGTWVSPSSK